MNKCCTHPSHQQHHTAPTSTADTVVAAAAAAAALLFKTNTMQQAATTTNSNCCRQDYLLTPEICAHIEQLQKTAFEFFERVLEQYTADQLMFSFNGGKDCTVLLDMLIKFCTERGIAHTNIPLLYIQSDDAFDEMNEFVDECVQHYGVQLLKYNGSLKEALTRMCTDMPRIKAVFLGSRNTDPYCADLAPMQPTDNGWPQLMRLSPILKWTYHDIWHYTRMHRVPYCRLYDLGYTSLGYRSNTVPNPHLRRNACDACGVSCNRYRPAYELEDGTLERAGRLTTK